MSDIWIWRAWDGVWHVGSAEDYWIDWIIRAVLASLLLALTIVVIIPVLIFEWTQQDGQERALRKIEQETGIPAWRLGPCPRCGNEQQRDGRPCVRCGA